LINDHNKLKRLELPNEREGAKILKLIQLKAIFYHGFKEHRDTLQSIHDVHLNHWAIAVSDVLGLQNCKAGKTLIASFKKSSGITSHKITKFFTKITKKDDAETREKAQGFLTKINKFKDEKNISAKMYGTQMRVVSIMKWYLDKNPAIKKRKIHMILYNL